MNNWEEQMKEAFDMVHMEPSLKKKTQMALIEKTAKKGTESGGHWKNAAVVFCVLLVVFAGCGCHVFFRPVNVISIDINPSVELGINAFDRVVSVDAYNDDGEALAQELPLRFLKSVDAVNAVIDSDVVQSLLSGEDELTLTVVGEDEAKSEALCIRLENSVDQTENISCHSALSKSVENAHHCGLSYGKYLAYLQAQAQNPDLQPEDVQNMTMQEIRSISGNHCGFGNSQQTGEQTASEAEETQPNLENHHMQRKKTHKRGHH